MLALKTYQMAGTGTSDKIYQWWSACDITKIPGKEKLVLGYVGILRNEKNQHIKLRSLRFTDNK